MLAKVFLLDVPALVRVALAVVVLVLSVVGLALRATVRTLFWGLDFESVLFSVMRYYQATPRNLK